MPLGGKMGEKLCVLLKIMQNYSEEKKEKNCTKKKNSCY